MEKLAYLFNRPDDIAALGARLRRETIPALQALGASSLVLTIADCDEAVSAQAPQRFAGPWEQLGGALFLWLDDVDERGALEAELSAAGLELEAFLLTESVPQGCVRDWPQEARRPGVTQFTVHGKPADVDEAEFFRNWSAHTVLSFDLHPLRWSYVRNAVARPLATASTPAPRPLRALVLEHFRAVEDFTDDARYFGDPEVVNEMYRELPGFCDLESMCTGPMSEYWFD